MEGQTLSYNKKKKKKRTSEISRNFLYPETWPRGYKTFFVLNSVEHELLNAHTYKNIKKFGIFKVHVSLECYFSAHTC